MKQPLRRALILVGAALLLIVGFFVYLVFFADDTKKTQSIELPEGRVLNIYLTSEWEFYDCKFELLEARSKKVLIPKTHFHWERYLTFESASFKSTPESRTQFAFLVGVKSGIVGLVSPEDAEHVLLLINPAKSNFFAPDPTGLSEEDKKLGGELLAALKTDFPDKILVLSGTREDVLLKRQRDIERMRQNFARMDAASQLGSKFSDVLEVSWEPTTVVTNNNGIIEARICDDQPSITWLGRIKDIPLTNGFVLQVSNGIVVGKTYLSTTEY